MYIAYFTHAKVALFVEDLFFCDNNIQNIFQLTEY